jgi:hypothetical protein
MVVDNTKPLSDAEMHEALMEGSLGNMNSRLSEWSLDLSMAIDIWILGEFREWVRKKYPKTTFSAENVDISEYWEKDSRVKYKVSLVYAGKVDADIDERVRMVIVVRNGCGPAYAPTQLVLEFMLLTDLGPKTVRNSFGTVLNGKDSKVKIAGHADPLCGR